MAITCKQEVGASVDLAQAGSDGGTVDNLRIYNVDTGTVVFTVKFSKSGGSTVILGTVTLEASTAGALNLAGKIFLNENDKVVVTHNGGVLKSMEYTFDELYKGNQIAGAHIISDGAATNLFSASESNCRAYIYNTETTPAPLRIQAYCANELAVNTIVMETREAKSSFNGRFGSLEVSDWVRVDNSATDTFHVYTLEDE